MDERFGIKMGIYLRIATSQFPVSHDMAGNFAHIQRQICEASANHADVIHFPETALPGYLGFPERDPNQFDWDTLGALTGKIRELAHAHRLWVILGTIRKVKGQLPRNCLCVISNAGEIPGYYDKQRIYKSEKAFYSAGRSPLVVNIKGYACGFLICYDNCFPELYRPYRKMGVGLLFHSFHNAGNQHQTGFESLMAANLLVRAADHQMWISASNSSQAFSPLPATIARPDGSVNRAERHAPCLVLEDYPKAKLGWTYDNRRR